MDNKVIDLNNHRERLFVAVFLFLLIAVWYFKVFPKEQEGQSGIGESESALLMSVNELKAYKGFENFSDKDATSYIRSMQAYCMITYELYKQEKAHSDEKQS